MQTVAILNAERLDLDFLSYFFGGAFLINALPHLISGAMGRPFQSPFAKPPGQGQSSSSVNLLWGMFNLLVFYGLVCRVGEFDFRNSAHALAVAAGMIALGLFLARRFGRFNGGNSPESP